MLDFWRGIALIFILIDHLWISPLHVFSLRTWGLCTMVDVFILISGYVSSLVYSRKFEAEGITPILKRVRSIYVTHVTVSWICMGLMLLFGAALLLTGKDHLPSAYSVYFDVSSWLFIPLLIFQIPFNDILPSYIILLVSLPIIIYISRKSLWLLFIFSLSIWIVGCSNPDVNIYKISKSGWHPNPIIWQFTYCLGFICGEINRRGIKTITFAKWLPCLGALVIGGIAFWRLSMPEISRVEYIESYFTGASALARTSYMVLLAYVVVFFIKEGAWLRVSIIDAISRCGRQSLDVFALHVLIVYAVQTPLKIVRSNFYWHATLDVAMQLFCICLLMLGAYYIEKYKFSKKRLSSLVK